MYALEILDYVESETSLTIGTDLFLGNLADGTDEGVIIFDSPGMLNDSGMLQFQIGINSVARDYYNAKVNCILAFTPLAYSNGFTIDNRKFFNTTVMSTPAYLGLNEKGYSMFSASIIAYTEV
jgi:hypothetical protein